MKRLSLVLLVLGLAVPASADVLIYNSKQTEAEMQGTSGAWAQIKGSYMDYGVIEAQSGGKTANVWSVMTYKAKDQTGKTQNYYTTQNLGTMNLLQVQVGTKQKWIITGATSQLRIILTGDWKPGKPAPGDHGNGPKCSRCHSGRPDQVSIPASVPAFTGSLLWDQAAGADRSIGTGQISMKLNTKMTNDAANGGFNSSAAVNYVVGVLKGKGYIQGS